MAKIEAKIGDELSILMLNIKSRILEGIASTIADPNRFADCTSTYTKSDGTNYGMYQKTCSVSAYEEIWETISGGRAAAPNVAAVQPGLSKSRE
jgi:hypothetical protein